MPVVHVDFKKKSDEKPQTLGSVIESAFGIMNQQEAIDHALLVLKIVAEKCKTTDAELLRMVIAAKNGEME